MRVIHIGVSQGDVAACIGMCRNLSGHTGVTWRNAKERGNDSSIWAAIRKKLLAPSSLVVQTLKPQPQTLNPKPKTCKPLHPKPLNPKTLNLG